MRKHRIIIFTGSKEITVSLFSMRDGVDDPKKIESWEKEGSHYRNLKDCFEQNSINPHGFFIVGSEANPITLQNF